MAGIHQDPQDKSKKIHGDDFKLAVGRGEIIQKAAISLQYIVPL